MHKESRFDNNLDDISINSEIKELKLDLVEKNTKQSVSQLNDKSHLELTINSYIFHIKGQRSLHTISIILQLFTDEKGHLWNSISFIWTKFDARY